MMPSLILLTAAAAVVFGSAFISMAAAEGEGVGVSGNNSNNTPGRNQEMEVAKEEMQRANYFAYVMLINLAPSDLFRGNVTFLMPKDRTLATNMMMRESTDVADFLLRHSIPSPLLMEHLQHFPTGSILPSCRSKQPHDDQLLRITNNGRRSFFLNNVRIIRPNICTMGSSIRCHGIDGVIQDSVPTPPSAADECHNSNNNSSSTTPPPSPSSASSDKKNDTSSSSGSTTAEAPKGVEGHHPNKSAANSVVVERKWCSYFGVCEIMITRGCLTLLILMKLCL